MCKCDPTCRTPFCGKPGCEPPPQKPIYQTACPHEQFDAWVEVNRVVTEKSPDKVIRYTADVRVACRRCKLPFRFIGLPHGLDLNGAACSIDGTEARLVIAPQGEVLSELEGTPHGFTVRKEY